MVFKLFIKAFTLYPVERKIFHKHTA